jgi:hypothetical protein
MSNILDALKSLIPTEPERSIQSDGFLSMSDAVFSTALYRAGVDQETIDWRMKEDVGLRADVISMYQRGVK